MSHLKPLAGQRLRKQRQQNRFQLVRHICHPPKASFPDLLLQQKVQLEEPLRMERIQFLDLLSGKLIMLLSIDFSDDNFQNNKFNVLK